MSDQPDSENLQNIEERLVSIEISLDKLLVGNKNLQYLLYADFANKLKDEIEHLKDKVNDRFSSDEIIAIIENILHEKQSRCR